MEGSVWEGGSQLGSSIFWKLPWELASGTAHCSGQTSTEPKTQLLSTRAGPRDFPGPPSMQVRKTYYQEQF